MITVSAATYTSSDANCMVAWVRDHLISSSALSKSISGTVISSAWAALGFMTNSNLLAFLAARPAASWRPGGPQIGSPSRSRPAPPTSAGFRRNP